MNSLGFFVIITLLNIVTSVMKTVAMVKSGPFMAGTISTVNATINAVSTLVISKQQNTVTVILVVLIANAVAVPGTKFLLQKFEKDKMWVYNATIKATEDQILGLRYLLKNTKGIHCVWTTIVENNMYDVKIFVYTKEESRIVKNQLDGLHAKYYIIEPR